MRIRRPWPARWVTVVARGNIKRQAAGTAALLGLDGLLDRKPEAPTTGLAVPA